MYTIKAKYNSANIMLPENHYLDEETTKQIYSFLNHPAFAKTYIAVMPDAHAGKGACVGLTMKCNDYVIPNVVGVDLGCGMTAIEFSVTKEDWELLDKIIRKEIPSGFSRHKDYRKNVYGLNSLYIDALEKLGKKIEQDVDVTLGSLGTLGGGNHFIEVSKGKEDNTFILVVHSGSRNLGLKVAEYHQNKAKALMNIMFIGDAYKGLEFLVGEDKDEYIQDAKIAQEYASLNRKLIIKRILDAFDKLEILSFENIQINYKESVHNYIDTERDIIRKGAISAREGEDVIIPLNMRDGIIYGKGKGSAKWNFSAPHGAGRILSRTQAKKEIDLETYKESMKNVWTSSVSKDTLDEAPDAYKSAEMIVEAIQETVEVDFIGKPVYNFKAS